MRRLVLPVAIQSLSLTSLQQRLFDAPRRLNHSWCYEVTGAPVDQEALLVDQFGTDTLRVEKPRLFCNPVEKVRDGRRDRIVERDVHLTCYDLHGPQRTEGNLVEISNQFEQDIFKITAFELLCVPSEKKAFLPGS